MNNINCVYYIINERWEGVGHMVKVVKHGDVGKVELVRCGVLGGRVGGGRTCLHSLTITSLSCNPGS